MHRAAQQHSSRSTPSAGIIKHITAAATGTHRYYKKLDMPEMKLLQLVAEPSRLQWQHSAGTLTVHYAKPPALLAQVRWRGGDMQSVCQPVQSVPVYAECAERPAWHCQAFHTRCQPDTAVLLLWRRSLRMPGPLQK